VLVPNVQNPFFAELVCGIEALCRQTGYSVFLCNSDNDPKRQQDYLRTLLEKRVDGLLLSAAGEADVLAQLFQRVRVPLVAVDRLVPAPGADRVSVDNRAGAYTAVKHLLDLGHTRIACISGPAEFDVASERVQGWRQALQDHGLQPDEQLLVHSDFSSAGGYETMRALLRGPQGLAAGKQCFTALFASNDLMAIGALRAASEANCRVPEQLSVVGFDDIELGGYVFPSLTTVGCAHRELGHQAGQLLIARIENPKSALRDVRLTPRLVVRESTARLGPISKATSKSKRI